MVIIDRFRRRKLENLNTAIEGAWSAAAFAGDEGDDATCDIYTRRAQQLEKERNVILVKLGEHAVPVPAVPLQPN